MDGLKKAIAKLQTVVGKKIEYEEVGKESFSKEYTTFRFSFQGKSYVGALRGTDRATAAFAALLPAQLEGWSEEKSTLTKSEFLKKLVAQEGSPSFLYRYAKKYSVQDTPCFVAIIEAPKMLSETGTLVEQYGGNGLDCAFETDDGRLAFVRFCEGKEEVAAVEYADFLAQFIKEELGLDARIGVGPVVASLAEIALSYEQALGALRYAQTFGLKEQVLSYKDFVLVRILEELPAAKLQEYLALLSKDNVKEIFEDEEMLITAKEFLHGNLNVSETARSMYLHRNTLTYRLDKIERATGLNIRNFADATSFHLLSLLYALSAR